ncbi:MAG: transglutaminase-like domain-containing protein [Candidatus Saccharimonadales bacterium]
MNIKQQLDILKDLARLEFTTGSPSLEVALGAAQFVESAFTHNGDNQPSHSDPVSILKEAQAGAKFRCVEYSHLAAWLMVAYGVEARTVNIMTKDVETQEYGAGHVVVEFYGGERHGWVMADIQAGAVARCADKLQSSLELRESINDAAIENFDGSEFVESEGMFNGDYKEWLKPYLYFIDRPQELNFEYTTDSGPHFMLVPTGDKPPKYFQQAHKLNLIVTSPNVFYKRPD